MVCITHTMVSIPEARVFASKKPFFTRKTIFRATEKTLSGFVTLVFVSHTMGPVTQAMVFVVFTTVSTLPATDFAVFAMMFVVITMVFVVRTMVRVVSTVVFM